MNNVQVKSFDAVSISLIYERYSNCLPCQLVLSFTLTHCYLSSRFVLASASILSLPHSVLTSSKIGGRKKKKNPEQQPNTTRMYGETLGLPCAMLLSCREMRVFRNLRTGCACSKMFTRPAQEAHWSKYLPLNNRDYGNFNVKWLWQMQPNTTWWNTSAIYQYHKPIAKVTGDSFSQMA